MMEKKDKNTVIEISVINKLEIVKSAINLAELNFVTTIFFFLILWRRALNGENIVIEAKKSREKNISVI